MDFDLTALDSINPGDRVVYSDGADEKVVGEFMGGHLLQSPKFKGGTTLFLNLYGHTILTIRAESSCEEPSDWLIWLTKTLDETEEFRKAIDAANELCRESFRSDGVFEIPISKISLARALDQPPEWEAENHNLKIARAKATDVDPVHKRAARFVKNLGAALNDYKLIRQQSSNGSGFEVVRLPKPGQAMAPVFVYGPRPRDEAVVSQIVRGS
ncbi:MAG: hypothetical protein GKR97_08330 [Rhizobiaceae bacterium]|nr:hypothetical protein [Rhizobiaceae bacterium]